MTELQKNETMQDVGKKLSGFLGGVVEKAKNLDVNELTERAKQKLNDVKDKANELNLGKTAEAIKPREEISEDYIQTIKTNILNKNKQLSKQVNLFFSDLGKVDNIIFSIRLENSDEYLVLTKKQLFYFFKSSEQYGVYVYNLKHIESYTIVPPRNEIVGKFVINLKNNDLKFSVTNLTDYFSFLLLYENINRELSL